MLMEPPMVLLDYGANTGEYYCFAISRREDYSDTKMYVTTYLGRIKNDCINNRRVEDSTSI